MEIYAYATVWVGGMLIAGYSRASGPQLHGGGDFWRSFWTLGLIIEACC